MNGIRRIVALLDCAVAVTAQAQTFPWKTVRLVSGVPPGSASGTMARVISEQLQVNLGQGSSSRTGSAAGDRRRGFRGQS